MPMQVPEPRPNRSTAHEASSTAPVRIARVVGAAGSGKTLLVTALADVLRARGVRVVTATRRADGATVLVVAGGGRATVPTPLDLDVLPRTARSLDPAVELVLVEGIEDRDSTTPCIALRDPALGDPAQADGMDDAAGASIIGVDAVAFRAAFTERGPRAAESIADEVMAHILGREAGRDESRAGGWRNWWTRRRGARDGRESD